MTRTNDRKLKMLKDIIMLSQEQLHKYISTYVSYYYESDFIIENDGSFIYVEGDIPVVLVAHLDTVHSREPLESEIFYDQDKQVMWSPVGIGADCRAGVFNILDIIARGYRPHLAFTWNEEIGGIGAHAMAAMINPRGLNFAIEFDRRGESQAVYYDCGNQEFEDYITSFGYTTHHGSYSDICELCPSWDIAGVNLSAGYINEHTDKEMLLFYELLNSQEKVIEILKDQMENPRHYDFQEIVSPYGSWGSGSSSWGSYGGDSAFKGWSSYDTSKSSSSSSYLKTSTKDDVAETCEGCRLSFQWYHMCGVDNFENYCDTCYSLIEDGYEPTPKDGDSQRTKITGEQCNCPTCGDDVFYNEELGDFCSSWCQQQSTVAYLNSDDN